MASEDQGPLTNILVWVFTCLAMIFVALRLLSRTILKPNVGWDDFAISVALVVDIAYSIVISIAVSRGTGAHASALETPHAAAEAAKWDIIAVETGIFSFGIPKVAIALLLGRILNIRRSLCWAMYGLAALLMVYAIVQDIVFIMQCDPPSGAWNRQVKARCWDPWPVAASGMAYSAYSAFLDIFYGVVPVAVISRLNMHKQKKAGLCIMMGLGIFAGIIAAYKTSKLPSLASPKADFTYATAPLLYWSSIEANVVILAACVPTIGPFVRLVARSTGASTLFYSSDRRTGEGASSRRNYEKPSSRSYRRFRSASRARGDDDDDDDDVGAGDKIGPRRAAAGDSVELLERGAGIGQRDDEGVGGAGPRHLPDEEVRGGAGGIGGGNATWDVWRDGHSDRNVGRRGSMMDDEDPAIGKRVDVTVRTSPRKEISDSDELWLGKAGLSKCV